MCTMTWCHDGRALHVLFNRDERRSRPTALPPARHVWQGVPCLAPLDPQGGGTWLAASERGLCLAVLNGDGSVPDLPGRTRPSRGLLPAALAAAASPEEAVELLASLDLRELRPFLLAAIDFEGRDALARWDGAELTRHEEGLRAGSPLVSSSFAGEEVRASRRRVFESLRDQAPARSLLEVELAYHRSHEPERGPRSPCMHRPDARTVSFTHVVIGPERLSMTYTPDAPCRGVAMQPVTLERRPRH